MVRVKIVVERGNIEVIVDGKQAAAKFREAIDILKDTIRMLETWLVKAPVQEPWYKVQPCKYCKEARKRWEKITSPYNWWTNYCKRHVAAEFLSVVSIFGNRKKMFAIDMDKQEIFIEAHTNRHCGKYLIRKDRVIAELDGTPFTYKPHTNALPYEPAYNVIVKNAINLLSYVQKLLEIRYIITLYSR